VTHRLHLRDLGGLDARAAVRAAVVGVGLIGCLAALLSGYALALVLAYEVLVSAGVPMAEPSTTLLVLRFPAELPVVAGMGAIAAAVTRALGGGLSTRDGLLLAAAAYTVAWAALLLAGVETGWVIGG